VVRFGRKEKSVGWIAGSLALLFGSLSCVWPAAPYESEVRAIDQEVLSIDKQLSEFTQTSKETCQEDSCTTTVSYWGPDGRIRKVAEEGPSQTRRGSVSAHFYSDCRLILTRVAPAESSAPKNLTDVEKYYFQKGQLIRVEFGDEIETFGKDQAAYYQRTMDIEPEKCSAPEE